MPDRTCETCAAWASSGTVGECRYNPPTLMDFHDRMDVAWPMTTKSEWCFQYVPRELPSPPPMGRITWGAAIPAPDSVEVEDE